MRRCAAKPYEGNEKYIFVSYCHRDKTFVFPIIEQLARFGYRIWYDEGIDPGSEWPEIIANHLSGCSACIAMISENSINSHNCRREINFALLKKRFFISVILEPVQMSLGMEMQLSSSQSIFKYTLSSDAEFYDKLKKARELDACLGEPDNSVYVSHPTDYEDVKPIDKNREPFSDQWFREDAVGSDRKNDIRKTEEEAKRRAEEEARRKAEEEVKRRAEEENRRKTEEEAKRRAEEEARRKAEEEAKRRTEEENRRKVEEDENETQYLKIPVAAYLKRIKTNETIIIDRCEFVLGRSETKADYHIEGNHLVSRVHAIIYVVGGKCYLADQDSKNKTYINGKALEPDNMYPLKPGDTLRLANEQFVYEEM